MSDLTPCPGCDGTNISITESLVTGWFFGFCNTCGWQGPADTSESGAVEAWNTRPREYRLQGQLDEAHRDKDALYTQLMNKVKFYGGRRIGKTALIRALLDGRYTEEE